METSYQTIDQSGISIPLAIVRSFGLSESTRIAVSWQKDGIRVAPAEVSAEEIENRALRLSQFYLCLSRTVAYPMLKRQNWRSMHEPET